LHLISTKRNGTPVTNRRFLGGEAPLDDDFPVPTLDRRPTLQYLPPGHASTTRSTGSEYRNRTKHTENSNITALFRAFSNRSQQLYPPMVNFP